MSLKRITFLLLAAIFLITACSKDEGTPVVDLPSTGSEVSSLTATPSIQPTATLPPTATLEPTPVVPSIEVGSQMLNEDGQIVIEQVVMPDGGWLAIFQEIEGEAGDLLGFERMVPGENSEITVAIEPREATDSLIAQLYQDLGESGEFEFQGADSPLEDGTGVMTESFDVDIQLPIPAIDVTNQDIGSDGLIVVSSVFALEPGWLVIHNYKDDEIGIALGQIPVQPGNNIDLTFPIRWRIAATELMAVLYLDAEQPGGFDKDVDLPVIDEGEAVVTQFTVSLPPDILIFDQPVLDSKLIIERATNNVPGWIVAYYDEEDLPGLIIGSTYIEAGVNEMVELEVLETAVTQRLFLLIHEDSGALKEFDFPAADLPVIVDGQPLPPIVMHTAPGNYLITSDQTIGEGNTIIVPMVISDLDTWLVIYNINEEGTTNEIIGQTNLPAGINRNIEVVIDPELVTDTIMAMLHQNNPPLESFDFPDTADFPLQRNLEPIQSPIILEGTAEEEEPRPLP